MKSPNLIIRRGTAISEMSDKDLPSPADIKGENNMMLLPYYQEVSKPEATRN